MCIYFSLQVQDIDGFGNAAAPNWRSATSARELRCKRAPRRSEIRVRKQCLFAGLAAAPFAEAQRIVAWRYEGLRVPANVVRCQQRSLAADVNPRRRDHASSRDATALAHVALAQVHERGLGSDGTI